MRYVTSIEQMAMEKGMQQGLQQGMQQVAQETLLAILENRFGPVAPEIVALIQQMTDVPTLQTWTIQAATIKSLLAFKQYISQKPGMPLQAN